MDAGDILMEERSKWEERAIVPLGSIDQGLAAHRVKWVFDDAYDHWFETHGLQQMKRHLHSVEGEEF